MLYESHQRKWSDFIFRTPQSIGSMQHYLSTPTEEKWSSVLDQLRYHRAIWLTSSDRARPGDHQLSEKEEWQCREFEQKNGKLSRKEVLRLRALIQIAAIIDGKILPDWSEELLRADDNKDKSQGSGCRWGQPYFQEGSTRTLLKKVYRSSSARNYTSICQQFS